MKQPIPILALLLLTALPLTAQNGGSRDGDLYIPPDLSIGLSSDMRWLSRLYGAPVEVAQPEETQLRVERNRSGYNTLRPLPIIFFDQASSTIPSRYQTFGRSLDADDYREEQEIDLSYEFANRQFAKYREILNIIGYRMSLEDTTSIRLLGGYSTEPGENGEIAGERADVVAEYLRNVWRIDPSRITILPPERLADSADHIMAQEEARSVRIYPDDPTLLRTVTYGTVELETLPITIAIGLAPNMPRSEIATARLVIASGDDILGETVLAVPEGEEYVPIGWTGLWFLPRRVDNLEEALSFNLLLETRSGSLRASNTVTIPVIIEDPEEDDEVEHYGGLEAGTEIEFEGFDDEGGYYEGVPEDGEVDRDTDYLEGELPFFDFRDTTLSRLQQTMIVEEFGRIEAIFAIDSAERWRLRVAVDGDFTENPEADDALLRVGRSIYHNSTMIGSTIFEDPDFQVSLYIFPESTGNPEEFDQVALTSDIIDQMYGNRAAEIRSIQEEAGALYDDRYSFSGDLPLFDSLLVARGRGFVASLAARLDTSRLDSLVIHPERRYTKMVQWLPEERYYERTLIWKLYREDSWRWDEDRYDLEDSAYDFDEEEIDEEEMMEEGREVSEEGEEVEETEEEIEE